MRVESPSGVLSKYRYPLSYVGAIIKILSKVQKSVPHFGRRELYSEWGRSPGIRGPRKVPQRSEDTLWGFGEEGVFYSHVRGRQLVYSPSTTLTPSEHSRDDKHIRSVPEYDEQLDRAPPSAPDLYTKTARSMCGFCGSKSWL